MARLPTDTDGRTLRPILRSIRPHRGRDSALVERDGPYARLVRLGVEALDE
jgi:hypothetical protein